MVGCAALTKTVAPDFCPSETETHHISFGQQNSEHLIIFVHGFCGDAQKTWINEDTKFDFPAEIAKDLKDSYVISFAFVSNLDRGPSIESAAKHLATLIDKLHQSNHYSTIRFVAHSTGGLVVRDYILRHQPDYNPWANITNVILLATPSQGTDLAVLQSLVPENRQAEELKNIDKGNTWLESLNDEWNKAFKAERHPRHLLLYAGFEEKPLAIFGKVVKLSSAIAYADGSLGFQTDHFGLAKPKDRDDLELYFWVKARLQESLPDHAQQLVQGLIRQGLFTPADVSQKLSRVIELLEQLQDLTSTDLKDIPAYIKAGKFDQALALLADTEFKETQAVEKIAQRRYVKAQVYELQFQMAQAGTYYLQAVQLAPAKLPYRMSYGTFLRQTGNAREAIPQFEEALRLARLERNENSEAAALRNLGIVYDNLGQYPKAIEFYEQALAISRNIGDLRGEGTELGNLGNTYDDLGQYPKAIEFHEQALAISRKTGDPEGEGTELGNLGNTYDKLGQKENAITSLEQAQLIYEKRLRLAFPRKPLLDKLKSKDQGSAQP